MVRNCFYIILILISFSQNGFGQELNCKVIVDYSKLSATTNTQVFKTLEKSLNDFVNKTTWTEKNYKDNEKINCNFFISVSGYDSNQFEASIQVESSRPTFNSTYSSPILNINDKDFNFQYTEFEGLTYSPNSFDSNLISVLAFYCNIIIGVDAETFALGSGDTYFENAQNITSLASTSSYKGWTQGDKTVNRYYLINDLMSNSFKPYKEAMYAYQYLGLDTMNSNLLSSKTEVKKAILIMDKVFAVRPSAYLLRIFFDAKADEIVSIFSGGPSVPVADLVDTLNKISPTNSSKWSNIKP
ncbi:MAG: DUF4835 family protein [Flavobacterium sp.]|nr:DUF4835 family protein [Flavobacterium sp.]